MKISRLAALIAIAPIVVNVSAQNGGGQQSRDQQIKAAAEALRPKLVEQRRDFHMHPELSNREERTSRIVAERLRALGLDEVKTGVARYGVVALLKGSKPGPVVAVRADMDALPIQETIDVPYKSQVPGVKHACGHDAHTTIEIGVAEVLSKMRDQISGSIKFVFQPAEEGAPSGEEGGASLMVKEGALDNPRPLAIFGLHTSGFEVGEIGYHSGPAMASSDRFAITIRGKKSHGAQPQLGIDAIVVASECVAALQTIRSRRIDPIEPMVLTLGTIKGGDRYNIIADQVQIEGTLRTLNEDVRSRVKELMRQTLASVTSGYGASFDLTFDNPNPVTFNDTALVQETIPSIKRIIGEKNLVSPKPLMPAEDFSYYQRVIPGFFFFLGVGNKSRGLVPIWHTAEFDIDEESLVVGVRVMSAVLLDFLDRHQSSPTGSR